MLVLALAGSRASAKSAQEAGARQKLAEKLMRVGSSLDMKEKSFRESAGGGKDYNANDGNSFTSNTTYHSYVWDYCLQWVGGRFCRKWLDPYVSSHAFTGDQSPLEGIVGSEWRARAGNRKEGQQVAPGNFGIWNVERQDGKGLLDVDGKLERKGITRWEMLPEVRERIEKQGTDTAVRQISITYDDSTGKGSNIMPNMESLRVMAQRWTKMYRNRMVANIGESWAMSRGVEFALGEDKANCAQYQAAMQRERDETGVEERVNTQGVLDPDTKTRSLQQRYAACVALRSMSVYSVNPESQSGKIAQGDPNEEWYDKAAARATIAAIDSVGINPNSLPKPGGVNFSKDQTTNELVDWESGGLSARMVRMSNAEQLNSYNNNLEDAAAGSEAVSSRTGGFIVDSAAKIRQFKIGIGTVNAVQLNGITPEMRGELDDTGFTSTTAGSDNVSESLENTPGELTVTRTP